jgi:large subunit ribosomal protein L25
MQKLEIQGVYREEKGKGPARQLRMKGYVPAVLYRKGSCVSLQLSQKEVDRAVHSMSGRNNLITIQITSEGNQTTRMAVIKEAQRHPLTDTILHLDLFEVSMNEPLTLKVPIEIIGTSVGIKAGGILQHSIRELLIQCLPAVIPDKIRVDITTLEIGQAIHARDIVLGEGVKRLGDTNPSIVSVIPPISKEKMEASLVTTPKDTKEPEVIGQKEKEEKEAAAGKGAEKGAAKGAAKEAGKDAGKDKGKK